MNSFAWSERFEIELVFIRPNFQFINLMMSCRNVVEEIGGTNQNVPCIRIEIRYESNNFDEFLTLNFWTRNHFERRSKPNLNFNGNF